MLTIIALVSRIQPEGGTRLKPAAAIVSTGDLEVVVRTIWQGDDSDRERLIRKVNLFHHRSATIINPVQEVELLTVQSNETPLEPFDIISDRRSVAALCLLYSSLVSTTIDS